MKSKIQKFEIETWSRQQIQKAPYNPRTISKEARMKLQENLNRVGLLEPIVVNKRTGNLVSGHQRLSIIDAMEGSNDYSLDVSVVDLSEKEEKEQNVFLNNQFAMGDFDIDALGKLLTEDGINFENTGFDNVDLQMLFQGTELDTFFNPENWDEQNEQSIEEIAEMKRTRKEYKEKAHERDDPEFFIVVVFPDRENKENCLLALGKTEGDRYLDAELIRAHLDPETQERIKKIEEAREAQEEMIEEGPPDDAVEKTEGEQTPEDF